MNAQTWQQLSLEFSVAASYSQKNPNVVFSGSQHVYQIDRPSGTWSYLGLATTDTSGYYFGNFDRGEGGPPRVLNLNNIDYYFWPTLHGGVAVYRIIPSTDPGNKGPTLKLVSCISSGGLPMQDGTAQQGSAYVWSWNNNQGEAQPISADITTFSTPSDGIWITSAITVDDRGYLWLATDARSYPPAAAEQSSLWVLPTTTVNSQGSPIYSWSTGFEVINDTNSQTAIAVTPHGGMNNQLFWRVASHSSDGMIYGLAWTDKPGTPQSTGLHTGGNVLMGFQESTPGTLQNFTAPTWKQVLPRVADGLAPITGSGAGGVLVGGNPEHSIIHHYAKDGLLIGTFGPGPNLIGTYGQIGGHDQDSGLMDSYQALSCERSPTDGSLDVFVQDNFNQRIMWFRVDDTHVTYPYGGSVTVGSANSGNHYALTVNSGLGVGSYLGGTIVNIRAFDPPVGMVFAGWTATGGAAVQSPSSISTTVTMPSVAASVTANYAWAPGNDMIRFYQSPNRGDNMDNTVLEGSNDVVNGPWTPFYAIPVGVSASGGWNEVSVNTGTFRYLRWRKRSLFVGGTIAEIEFYRNNVKLTGTPFGTAANGSGSYANAFDGSTATAFNWANTPSPGAYAGIDIGSSGAPEAPTAPTGLKVTRNARNGAMISN